MSEPPPILFERIGTSSVYETQLAGSVGWSGYLLPAEAQLPDSIGLEASLTDFDGHYLFCVERPALLASDPDAIAMDVLAYIKSATNNRVVLWLESANPLRLGDFDRFGFSFLFLNSVYQTTSNMNSRVGSNVTFYVLQQSRLLIDSAKGALRIFASASITPPFIGFNDSNGDPLGVQVATSGTAINVYSPFSGPNNGCCVFDGRMDTQQTFDAEGIGQGFRFIVNNTAAGQQETIRYRGYPVDSLPPVLNVSSCIDPSDPVNKVLGTELLEIGYLRSGFAIKGKPELISDYRTSGGNTVVLTPLGSSDNDLAPALGAGGFAWASQSEASSLPGEDVVYLGLLGQHGIGVSGVAAGSTDKLIGGLFGSETLSFVTYNSALADEKNDLLYVLPSQAGYAPVFPFEAASLEKPESGAVQARLDSTYLAPWSTIIAGAGAVNFSAEPEGSALYGQAGDDPAAGNDDVAVLLSTPPRMSLPQGNDKTFPMVPYGASADAGVDGDTLTQFESQIIAATRKTTISTNATATWQARAQARAARDQAEPSYATTPQGFIVQHDPSSSAYLNVQMAQSANLRQQQLSCTPAALPPDFLPFALVNPTLTMQDALQTNQLFLVAVNPTPFEDPDSGACFEKIVNIADWTMAAQLGRGATATSYKNVLIMKFCSGSLQDRVTNPNRWTAAPDFSLIQDTPPETAGLSYTGLSQWLQDYIDEGIQRAEGRSAAFYTNFKEIVTDPEWTGVIVLAADLSADDLPPEIAGLAAGIDFTRFAAHHFGFTVSRVSVDKSTGQISMAEGDSSLFGLVDYEDPRYASNLANGVGPDVPIPVDTADDFDFTVLQLQSLFENAKLVRFESHIQLTIDRLFATDVTRVYNSGAPQPATAVVLDGSYVEQGGRSTYVFEQDSTNVLHSDSNVLPAVAFNRIQFNTLGERDGGETIASRFLIWGAFDFVQLDGKSGELLDVLSFGSESGTPIAELGVGLAFSNLVIDMSFPQATPNAKNFVLDTDNLAWDLNASTQRDDGLFKGFALQLKSFVSASGEQKPSDLGFLPVTSDLQLTELDGPWFGVVYEITLGGPGALASGVGFQSQYLAAWAPTSTGDDTEHAMFLGMSLPGAAPGASLFSIQGVFKVAVGSISILRQEVPQAPGRDAADPEFFYCLRIDDIGIKIFGIVKLPPSANIQFFLFGDPHKTGSLGWYAAYVADDNPGCDQTTAFAEVESSYQPSRLTTGLGPDRGDGPPARESAESGIGQAGEAQR